VVGAVGAVAVGAEVDGAVAAAGGGALGGFVDAAAQDKNRAARASFLRRFIALLCSVSSRSEA
jgi:hypothetical protein